MVDFIEEVFGQQKVFQKLLGNTFPDVTGMYNMATAAMVEIGEMLQSDKRWKHTVLHNDSRPVDYYPDQFKRELADAILYLINVAIYSGINADEFKEAVRTKIYINNKRLSNDR